MRHRVAGRHLSRTSSHRKAMRRNMAASLIQHGAVRTTEPKAKDVRRFVERLITMARQNTLHARRRVIAALGDRRMTDDEGQFLDKTVVQKLFDEVAPRYVDRPGGYTRVIRLAEHRVGDAGTQVILQLVEESSVADGRKNISRRKRRAIKRQEAAAGVVEQATKDQQETTESQESVEEPVAAEDAEESQADPDAPNSP